MDATDHLAAGLAPPSPAVIAPERAARADLRGQIDRLERELSRLAASTYPRLPPEGPMPRVDAAPRVLELGELERLRDALADRLATRRAAAARQAERQADARALLERMYRDPPAHRRTRLRSADLGIPGCTTYEVVPQLGLVGMLAGWWRVKVSSGCPLSGAMPVVGATRRNAL
jgi:hypothetical protein